MRAGERPVAQSPCAPHPEGRKEAFIMSKKDVLHIPLEGVPPAPAREAGTEDEDREHHVPSTFDPGGGPGNGPGDNGSPRIIEPVGQPYSPGVKVT
ncbi:hypothetical protein D7W79_10815 [Corallococcus exercitus]|uniref:Uncharacterized protein n=2 Tax=Corallococcus exercitus TaxID=2316736 RepID=A0A3A8IH68_9BACT|nr:hypothetical protein [Corallococcus exercitus]RKG79254.1 hypothetical protein D7W79_10815 [Corallococcus exercitus]